MSKPVTSFKPTRGELVRSRWIDIVVTGVVGGAATLVLLLWRKDDLQLCLAAACWEIVAGGFCLGALVWKVGSGRWKGVVGLRHLPSHPPIWISGLIGAGVVLLSLAFFNTVRVSFGFTDEGALGFRVIGFLALGLAVVIAIVATWTALCQPPSKTTVPIPLPSSGSLRFDSFEHLREWIRDDQAVVSLSRDVFGHARIAERIAMRLSEQCPPAQAVVGRLGAGKTTVLGLVQELLQPNGKAGRVRIVRVELWPYENSKAAVEGVISSLVDAVAEEVSTLSLRGVSSTYAEAMSAAGGWWSALVRIQGVPPNPLGALKAIDRIAKAIGLHYVVWIEDLERFAGDDEANAERLSPIRALLYGLDQLNAITVVTATTTLRMRFDLEKIARFVEELPELPARSVRQILKQFRDGCLESAFIDPADSSARRQLHEFEYPNDNLGAIAAAIMGPGVHDIKAALPALCTTPRTLKQALRSCLEKWERLTGEVDFDDLFVLSILKEAQPDAFALIQEHLPYLRGHRSYSDERNKEMEKAWETAVAQASTSELMQSAVEQAVKFVFDKQRGEVNPQGVIHRSHADYWERFLSMPRLDSSERDQAVLRVIVGGDDQLLLALLDEASKAAALEDFKNLVPTAQLKRLLLLLVERRVVDDPQTWEEYPPGFISLWRMWLHRRSRDELSQEDVWEELRRAYDVALPRNLVLLDALEHYFATTLERGPDLLNNQQRGEAMRYLRENLVSIYQNDPPGLAAALRGAKTHVLLRLTWGLEKVGSDQMTGSPFPDWPTLASVVLEAARIEPSAMLEQLAALVVRESTVRSPTHHVAYEFDSVCAANLFGDVETVLGIFRRESATDWAGVLNVEAVLGVAQQTATRSAAS